MHFRQPFCIDNKYIVIYFNNIQIAIQPVAMHIFPRPALEARFWRALEGGDHLLIPGPRRIGKTTLLKQVLENPRPGFYPVYVFVESVDSADEFYRKLLSALSDQELVSKLTRLSRRFERWAKTIRISPACTD